MQQRKWARATAAVVLAGFLPLTACFGSFSLVRKVHSFNADVSSDPWVLGGGVPASQRPLHPRLRARFRS